MIMDHSDKHLNLLLFSVGGVYFGIDAEQALGTATYGGEEADDLFWFHEELDFDIPSSLYLSPTIITVRTAIEGPQYRVIVDSMEDIAQFNLNALRPFPPVLEPFVLRKGIWAILPGNGRMTFILDFKTLFNNKFNCI